MIILETKIRTMARILFFTFCFFVFTNTNAQVKTLPGEAKGFIPAGYEMLDYITGDLNNDKKMDAILVTKRAGEDTVMEEELKRPFYILLRQPDGKLRQVLKNDNAILCYHCGGVFGDPYEGIETKPGSFDITFYGGSSWRWGSTYSFKYNPTKKNWYLAKEKQLSFHAGDPETTTKESTITAAELGDVPVEKFDANPVYMDSRWKVKSPKTFFYDNPDLKSRPRKGYLVNGNVVTGIRHFKNFILASYENSKGEITEGYILRRDLQLLK